MQRNDILRMSFSKQLLLSIQKRIKRIENSKSAKSFRIAHQKSVICQSLPVLTALTLPGPRFAQALKTRQVVIPKTVNQITAPNICKQSGHIVVASLCRCSDSDRIRFCLDHIASISGTIEISIGKYDALASSAY